jgi:hypothetical protein
MIHFEEKGNTKTTDGEHNTDLKCKQDTNLKKRNIDNFYLKRKASLILNADSVLIGFIVLVVSSKDLRTVGNCTIYSCNVVPVIMSFSLICLVFSFLSSYFFYTNFPYFIPQDTLLSFAAVYMIAGLISLMVFVLTVGASIEGLLYCIAGLVALTIILLLIWKTLPWIAKHREKV